MPTRPNAARLIAPVAAALALTGAAASYAGNDISGVASATGAEYSNVHVCDRPAAGFAACSAIRHDSNGKKPSGGGTSSSPSGFGPASLRSAYAVPSSTTTATVAIVDAYDDPYAESDLATYRSQFGLAPCTTSNGCFKKVNQSGSTTSLPSANSSWSEEISLDLDMVSAICPSCHILLVEATSASYGNLASAVNTAAKLGAVAISNSYGGSESSGETTYDSYYNHPGIAVTVSSGDSGYGVQYPAASQYVIAVGGTSLKQSGSGWSETAWSGAGSGCSAYEPKPSWQKDSGCSRRTVADVSAVADPNTGVAVYDTYGLKGWVVFGGTSVASPLVASMYAIAGNGASTGSSLYSHVSSLRDVTNGSNGTCSPSYLCVAGAGYDGPTGLGTPQGVGAL